LFCSIFGFFEKEYAIAVVFLCFCFLPIFVFLISPMYVVFDHDAITVVYLCGVKERIPIKEIRNIEEEGSWFNKYSGSPEYRIAYPATEKHPFFADGTVPKTRKTKRIMNGLFGIK